jgi:integrase
MRIDERKAMWVYWSYKRIEYEMARRRHAQQGQFYEEAGSYYVRYWRDEIRDGELVRRRARQFLGIAQGKGKITKTEALQKKRDFLAEVDRPNVPPTAMMTFRDYFFGPYQTHLLATSKSHQIAVPCAMEKHILPVIGQLQLREIQRTHLQELLNAKARLSPSTIRHLRSYISGVLSHARADKVITGDLPTENLRVPDKRKVNPIPPLTFEQAHFVLSKLPQPYLTMAAISLTSSPNVAELCGIRRKRINLTSQTVLMDAEQLAPARSIWIAEDWSQGEFRPTKNPHRKRVIPVADAVVPLLEEVMRVADFKAPGDALFSCSTGKPVDDNNANKRIFAPLGQAIGLPFSWNSFRHTFASRSEDCGIRQFDKKVLMGHSLEADITDGYTEQGWQRMQSIVNELAARFDIEALVKERKGSKECPKVVSIR